MDLSDFSAKKGNIGIGLTIFGFRGRLISHARSVKSSLISGKFGVGEA